MKILALEFSSPQRSIAVIVAAPKASGATSKLAAPHASTLDPRPSPLPSPPLAPSTLETELIESGELSTQALGMVETALRQAQIERDQIECLAIGLGPGSYTGIRAAIALAQGWQLARNVKLLGLSSADAIAAQARADGLTGRVAVVIDAQRNEFYLANYELNPAGWRELERLRLASLAEVQAAEQAGNILIGPEVQRWFPSGRVVFPRAATLGRLALSRTEFVPGEKLEPIYLRETKFVKAPPPRIIP